MSNLIKFLVLYLLLDQPSQRKMHAELDGMSKEKAAAAITMADRAKLPFVQAVINVSATDTKINKNIHRYPRMFEAKKKNAQK